MEVNDYLRLIKSTELFYGINEAELQECLNA